MSFLKLPIETRVPDLIQRAFTSMVSRFPAWQPKEAHLEVGIIEENARLNSETRQVAVDVGEGIFREFGRKLLQVNPVDGAHAVFMADVTAKDDAGYTLPAGTNVQVQITGDEVLNFVSLIEVVIPPGSEEAEGVAFAADEVGEAFNGIPIATQVLLYDNGLPWVTSIVTTTESAGGVDREDDSEYLLRLADELRLMTPRPILADDFAVLARRTAGVHRAVAVDGYDPGPPEAFDQERMVTVAAVSETGEAVAPAILDQLQDDLDAMREVNFVVHAMDPTYTEIDIAFQVKARAGYALADVEAATELAVQEMIDPAHWGDEQDADGLWQRQWERKTVLRYLEVATVIENVPGVDHITTTGGLFDLTINGARLDVALGGQAPLPKPLGAGAGSSIAATVIV